MSARAFKILLVDDDEDSLRIARGLLAGVKDAAYELEWASTYEAGLEALRRGGQDACLLDYRLGARDGLELLRVAIAQGCRVPIVLMTGQGDREVDLRAMQAGAADFLGKDGLTATLLERVLRYAIERRRADDQRLRDEAQRQLITEHLPAILWTTDDQFRFTSTQGAGLLGLQLQPNELVGQTVYDYFKTRDLNHTAIAAHHRALAGESVSFEFEWMRRVYEACVDPLRQGQGQVVGTIGVALDITERRQIEADFRLARLIQQRLLPKSGPTLADFDIAGICRPTDATGGDFFDFVPMRDGSLGVVVADVSSHGFAPALIMSSTRRVLRTLAALNDDLATIVAATNRAIYEDTASDPFVTLFFARIDPATRVMRYIGAGHDAYLLDGDGEVTHLASTAPPLGVFDGFDFCCTEPRTLRPGQLLILLTDGFAEAMAPDGSLFGIGRTVLNISANRDGSAAEILEHLYQAICDYCHPQRPQDDVTGVIVKVNA